MVDIRDRLPSRRRLLHLSAGAAVLLPFAGLVRPGMTRAATPACGAGDPTPRQTAGPYFSPGSPQKADFTADASDGEVMQVRGRVLDTDCRPVAGALLDIWHADPTGAYDNRGFRMRGHQFADDAGRYRLTTLRPGLYPGRTRHIHIRVQAPGGPVLTTQLYFADEPGNDRDRIFRPELVMAQGADGGYGFDFVVAK